MPFGKGTRKGVYTDEKYDTSVIEGRKTKNFEKNFFKPNVVNIKVSLIIEVKTINQY